MRCNETATQDKIQLSTSSIELPGQERSKTISAQLIFTRGARRRNRKKQSGDTIILYPKSTGGCNVITDTDSNTALSRKQKLASLSTLNVGVRLMN